MDAPGTCSHPYPYAWTWLLPAQDAGSRKQPLISWGSGAVFPLLWPRIAGLPLDGAGYGAEGGASQAHQDPPAGSCPGLPLSGSFSAQGAPRLPGGDRRQERLCWFGNNLQQFSGFETESAGKGSKIRATGLHGAQAPVRCSPQKINRMKRGLQAGQGDRKPLRRH